MERKKYLCELIIENVKGEKDGKQYDFCTYTTVVDGVKIQLFPKERLANEIVKKALPTLIEVE